MVRDLRSFFSAVTCALLFAATGCQSQPQRTLPREAIEENLTSLIVFNHCFRHADEDALFNEILRLSSGPLSVEEPSLDANSEKGITLPRGCDFIGNYGDWHYGKIFEDLSDGCYAFYDQDDHMRFLEFSSVIMKIKYLSSPKMFQWFLDRSKTMPPRRLDVFLFILLYRFEGSHLDAKVLNENKREVIGMLDSPNAIYRFFGARCLKYLNMEEQERIKLLRKVLDERNAAFWYVAYYQIASIKSEAGKILMDELREKVLDLKNDKILHDGTVYMNIDLKKLRRIKENDSGGNSQ